MKIDKFIELFDENAIKDGKVQFTFYHGDSGKWNFWSEGETSRADLIKSIMENPTLAEVEIDGLDDIEFNPGPDGAAWIRIWFC